MLVIVTRKWLSGRVAVETSSPLSVGWQCREHTTTALEHRKMAISDACMCRSGRMMVLKDIHTDCSDQEASQALMRRFDLIPYTAAGCQRQVSGRMRMRGVGPNGCQIADPGAPDDG